MIKRSISTVILALAVFLLASLVCANGNADVSTPAASAVETESDATHDFLKPGIVTRATDEHAEEEGEGDEGQDEEEVGEDESGEAEDEDIDDEYEGSEEEIEESAFQVEISR